MHDADADIAVHAREGGEREQSASSELPPSQRSASTRKESMGVVDFLETRITEFTENQLLLFARSVTSSKKSFS